VTIPDRWRKAQSILGADPEGSDAQTLEYFRNLVERLHALEDALARSYTVYRRPVMALRTCDRIVENDGGTQVPGVWSITALTAAEDGITIEAIREGSTQVQEFFKGHGEQVNVLGPGPEAVGVELLADELGATYAGVGE
jgi:hypothetical protein